MHFLYNFVLLSIFIYFIFYFQVPNISDKRYIYHKFLIFLLIFIFQFLLYIISDFSKREYSIKEIALKTIIISSAAVIGYSVFNDLVYSNIIDVTKCDYRVLSLNVTVIITIAILFVKVIELSINTKQF